MANIVNGLDKMAANLQALADKVPGLVSQALYEEALIETKESMARTPVLSGALRASHVTNRPEARGGEIVVVIEVGGPAAPYALHVHENLDAHHKNGQAKFLESTLAESRPYMAERVAARIRGKIRL